MKLKLIIIIISAICCSCSKVDDIARNFEIKVEFKDDVSPVVATMSLAGSFDQIDWLFEDTHVPNGLSPNPVSYTFLTLGKKNIQVTAYKNGKKYFKKEVIEIPDVANEFRIIGVIFKDPVNLGSIESMSTDFFAEYGVGSSSLWEDMIFKTIHPVPIDTVFLYTPIIFDITNFLQKDASHQLINLRFDLGSHDELDFRSSFYLSTIYIGDRLLSPNTIHLNNLNTNSLESVNILCDWTRSR